MNIRTRGLCACVRLSVRLCLIMLFVTLRGVVGGAFSPSSSSFSVLFRWNCYYSFIVCLCGFAFYRFPKCFVSKMQRTFRSVGDTLLCPLLTFSFFLLSLFSSSLLLLLPVSFLYTLCVRICVMYFSCHLLSSCHSVFFFFFSDLIWSFILLGSAVQIQNVRNPNTAAYILYRRAVDVDIKKSKKKKRKTRRGESVSVCGPYY